MAMSTQQQGIFTTTSTVSPADLTLSIASVLMVFALLWLTWMAYSQLKLWHSRQTTFFRFNCHLNPQQCPCAAVGFYYSLITGA